MRLMDNYSAEEFERIVKESHSYAECLQNLGYHSNSGDSTNALKQKIRELGIDISHFNSLTPTVRTEENVFCISSTANQSTLRRWYTKGNYTPYICSLCGQEPVWKEKPLTLILDHINGINNDDRLENLRWVCPNCNQQLETTNARNPNRKYSINRCIDCGKAISAKSTRCVECFSRFRTSNEVEAVSRDELKRLIRTTPFTKIGEKFGVTDNAIRKWCDKYNLPRKASDIRKITDQDWEKI